VVDLVINVEKKGLTAEDVNEAFRKAAAGPLKGILDVCDTPLVSCDFRCSDVSTTIDSSLTMVMGQPTGSRFGAPSGQQVARRCSSGKRRPFGGFLQDEPGG